MKAGRARMLRLACVAGLLAAVPGCAEKAEHRRVEAPPVAVAAVEAQRVVEKIQETGELLAVNEASDVNAYDLSRYDQVIFSEKGLERLLARVNGGN